MTRFRPIVPVYLLAAAACLAYAPDAGACWYSTVCVQFPVSTDDLIVGDLPPDEDLIGVGGATYAVLPARGVRMTFIPPIPEPPRAVRLDEDGCYTFQSDFDTGFKLLIYPEAFLGDAQNIHIRGYASFTDLEAGTLAPPWLVHLNGISPGDLVNVEGFPSSDLLHFFALAIETVKNIEAATDPGLASDAVMHIYTDTVENADDDGDGNAVGGGYGGMTTIYLSDVLVRKKFVVAHEIGHWYASNWSPGYWTAVTPEGYNPYLYPVIDPECEFVAIGSNSWHGIRSAEYGTDAFVEGFGQFLAVKAFDDSATPDALYKYYKTIDVQMVPAYDKFVNEDQYIVSLVGGDDSATTLGGRSAWVENMCPADWQQPFEVASEIDWMRMLWQFLELDVEVGGVPTDKATLWHVFQLLDTASSADFAGWWDAVSDPANTDLYPLMDRFDALAIDNGVDNGA